MAKDIKDIIGEFKETKDAWNPLREHMADDLRFLEGGVEGQWPSDIVADRQADGRPCLVINKLPSFQDQVEGDIRQNRPGIKIKPVDSKADRKTARILTGLIKNIEMQSNADIAYNTASSSATSCGMGAFRIVTEYAGEDIFEQDIRIKRIKNPFTVYPDPNAQELSYEDGRFMFVTEKLVREVYKKQFPKADPCNWVDGKDSVKDWVEKDSIRIAEYFEKVDETKKIYLLRYADGQTHVMSELPEIMEGIEVARTRDVQTQKIQWYKVNGKEILEGPTDWPGRYFPIILVWGKELNIEGKTVYRGIVRHAKDPQRLYNYNRSTGAEYMALAPKAPYIGTAKQFMGHEDQWKLAHKRSYGYLLYNEDEKAPGPPTRTIPNMANTGIQYEIMISDQELHDTTGLQQASLGEKSNEKSGIAIVERRRQGDRGQFVYSDNLVNGMKYEGKVLVDLIPKIYDTERIERIFNEDGSEEQITLNAPYTDEKGKQHIYDVTTGKYDAVVSVGPSYQTQREEGASQMIELTKGMPDITPMIADLIVKNLDFPGAEEIQKRLQKLLPPGLAPEPEEGEEGLATGMPPPGAGPPQPPPDPKLEIEMAQEEEKLRKMKADADKSEIEADIALKELRSPEKSSD